MENSLKKRVLGTRRGFYGLIISVVSIVALCWMLYARDDARAEYEQLKASAVISKGDFKRGNLINVIKGLVGGDSRCGAADQACPT